MRRARLLLVSLFIAAACSSMAAAGPADEARLLVQQLGDRTVAAIKLDGKLERRLQLVADGALAMDYRSIAKNVLAQAGAKVSSEREIEVTTAVILYVSNQLITRLESVRPEKAEILNVEEKSPDSVLISMTLTGPQDSIVAVWTVAQTANGWHITDISESGRAITQHFGEVLRPHARTMDQLTQYLRENSPLVAGTASYEARALIQQLGERTVAAIKLEGKAERRLQLMTDGALLMDYRALAKSVLAYAGAKVPIEREVEVTEAVILYVSHQIISKVESVRPDKADITKVEEKSPDTVLISMNLTGPQDSIVAIWTVKLTANGWHVADLSASGYSLAQHFGQTLSSRARNIDQLMQYLVANSPLKRENLTTTQ